MSSTFAWLDHSESDRRKALDVVDLFHEQDTRDDLGIGTIRDALAGSLFPGISTIQTRANYLLFIPWIYQALEDDRTKSSDLVWIRSDCSPDSYEKNSSAARQTDLETLAADQ